MALSPKDAAEITAQMEEMGENQVRLRIQGGSWPSHLTTVAVDWLKQKDQEAQRRSDSSQAEQASIAREAKDAAVLASTPELAVAFVDEGAHPDPARAQIRPCLRGRTILAHL